MGIHTTGAVRTPLQETEVTEHNDSGDGQLNSVRK